MRTGAPQGLFMALVADFNASLVPALPSPFLFSVCVAYCSSSPCLAPMRKSEPMCFRLTLSLPISRFLSSFSSWAGSNTGVIVRGNPIHGRICSRS